MSKIIKNQESKTGYSIVINNEELLLNDTITDTSGEWIKLPSNPENRKWIKLSKLSKFDEYDLSSINKSNQSNGKSNQSKPSTKMSNWLDYLTPEEKLIVEDLKTKSLNRMTDPKEIARIKYEKAKAEYEKLLKEVE